MGSNAIRGSKHTTLLHGETLLVVTTGDLEEITLELITKGIARDLYFQKNQTPISISFPCDICIQPSESPQRAQRKHLIFI